jgi:hypothetical protein
MSDEPRTGRGMSPATAQKLEYAIIGIGVLALLMIFQPFSIALFTVGSILVVLAGLINNLLPLAQPGVPKRAVLKAAMIVAMIFCITLLRRVLPQAARSQHRDGQGTARGKTLVHAQLHLVGRDRDLCARRADRAAGPAPKLNSL